MPGAVLSMRAVTMVISKRRQVRKNDMLIKWITTSLQLSSPYHNSATNNRQTTHKNNNSASQNENPNIYSQPFSIHPIHQASKSMQCNGCQSPQILLFLPYGCDTITITIASSTTVVSKLILIQLVCLRPILPKLNSISEIFHFSCPNWTLPKFIKFN